MPLHSAEYWDAKAARAARKAEELNTPAARASMLLIAAQYKVPADRMWQTEECLAASGC
jgi:hypothetical protein